MQVAVIVFNIDGASSDGCQAILYTQSYICVLFLWSLVANRAVVDEATGWVGSQKKRMLFEPSRLQNWTSDLLKPAYRP